MVIGIVVIAVAVIICFLLAVANYSGERFFEKYEKLNKEIVSVNMSSLDFVANINKKHFENSLVIKRTEVKAGDAYAKGILILSNETLSTPSLASFTIISHELGHAKQDKEGNTLKHFNRLRRLGRFLGAFLMPLLLSGGIIMLLAENLFYLGLGLVCGGGLIFLISLFMKLKTISIEKQASTYAVDFLNEYLSQEELKKCKIFLKDARLTYWADFLRALFFWTFLTKSSKLFS